MKEVTNATEKPATPPSRGGQRGITTLELERDVTKKLEEGGGVSRMAIPGQPRLFMEVRPATRAASWVFRYTLNGTKGSTGLGWFCKDGVFRLRESTGLADACRKADAVRALVDSGVNPAKKKRADTAAAQAARSQTVRDAVEAWLVGVSKGLTSDKYSAQKARRLEEILSGPLGRMHVAEVRTKDVTKALEVLTSRGISETARRVLSDLSKAFSWAQGKGWRDLGNPCEGVSTTIPKVAQVGHRAPEDLSGLGAIVRAIRSLDVSGEEGPEGEAFDYGVKLTQLLMLTAARTSEIRLAKWDEVKGLDGDGLPRIEVPADRMKRRKAWTCYLSSQAVSIIRELSANADRYVKKDPRIFFRYHGGGRGAVCSENAVNLVLQRAGLSKELVGHGLRKLFSTGAHSGWTGGGVNHHKAIEHSMAHENISTVEATYNKSKYSAERAELMQWWADYLDRVAAADSSGRVVEFKRVA